MSISKIKSYAKINLSLGVLGKLKSNLHRIETFVSFLDLHDEIFIKQINNKQHKVVFYGKFSKKIPKKNTIIQLLDILDKKNLLKKKKYFIRVNKKIPPKSGMGGGSMNASTIFQYLINKNKIRISGYQILKVSNEISSDVIFGMNIKNSILQGNGKLIRFNKKIKFYTLVIKPNFGCSTGAIYRGIKSFSKPSLSQKNINIFNINTLLNLKNDLEIVAFKKYPLLLSIKQKMLNLPKVILVRMTGSGSSIVAYFNSKKATLNAAKILKRKYKNYWCILSKTI